MAAYPTGRHVVDICIGDERQNLHIECGVPPTDPTHPSTATSRSAGADGGSVEAYRSRWGDRRAELIVELLGRLKPR
jgi:hypothetical protein